MRVALCLLRSLHVILGGRHLVCLDCVESSTSIHFFCALFACTLMSMDTVHHDIVRVHGTDEHVDAHSVGESTSMTH